MNFDPNHFQRRTDEALNVSSFASIRKVISPSSSLTAGISSAFPSTEQNHVVSSILQKSQEEFHSIVQDELKYLLEQGLDREDAVYELLLRLVKYRHPIPSMQDIPQDILEQYPVKKEDAVRVFIVRQELVLLKRQGYNSFKAIQELTRRVQERSHFSTREIQFENSEEEQCGDEEDGLEDDENEEENEGVELDVYDEELIECEGEEFPESDTSEEGPHKDHNEVLDTSMIFQSAIPTSAMQYHPSKIPLEYHHPPATTAAKSHATKKDSKNETKISERRIPDRSVSFEGPIARTQENRTLSYDENPASSASDEYHQLRRRKRKYHSKSARQSLENKEVSQLNEERHDTELDIENLSFGDLSFRSTTTDNLPNPSLQRKRRKKRHYIA